MQHQLNFSLNRPESRSDDFEEDLKKFNFPVSGRGGVAGLNRAFRIYDAYQIKICHVFDKLTSLSNSRTRLLPHQIEATHRVASALKPRFILADEVGLGKTIEAGLVIKELTLRRDYQRILVVTPATLCVQWQNEMRSKFNEEYEILDRSSYIHMANRAGRQRKYITSIDFIKNPLINKAFLKYKWDAIIVDEAHRLRRDYSKVTQAYAFAAAAAEKCEAMLLLTATPFRGKMEELFYLIHLIDPNLLGPFNSFMQEYGSAENNDQALSRLRNQISRVMIRRRKVEVGGFTRRFVRTVVLELSEEERLLYDEATEYVKREYNLAMQNRNRAVGFVMVVFQKLLDSSTQALLSALEKRKCALEELLYNSGAKLRGAEGVDDNEEFDEDEEELFENEELPDRLGQISNDRQRNFHDLRREILNISRLINIARSIREDRKLSRLKDTLRLLKKEGHHKFVIFTQFRTTLEYLADNLKEFTVTVFHGSLNARQKEDAVGEFAARSEIFICTEAGGEGRNLQFASILFNYDLPWSPVKIEQRIGRIHRFGQKLDVKIFNFSTRDTVAERVLAILEKKIKLFEGSIGPSDALLGALEDEVKFQNNIMQFVAGKKSKADLEAEISSGIKIAEAGYTKLNELYVPQCLDFNLQDYYQFTQQERAIENSEIENLTLQYLEENVEDEYSIELITAAGKKNDSGKKCESNIYRLTNHSKQSNKLAVFSSEAALENGEYEFLAVGHRLVDRAMEYYLTHSELHNIQLLPQLPGLKKGFYFIAICHYLNGMSRADLMSAMVSADDFRDVTIPEEPLIPVGLNGESLALSGLAGEEEWSPADQKRLQDSFASAASLMRREAKRRAEQLGAELHPVFKKEEYKLEISAGKKIRQLREKLDRQRLRLRQEPRTELRAAVTRSENELMKVERDYRLELARIRNKSQISCRLELLQIYKVI